MPQCGDLHIEMHPKRAQQATSSLPLLDLLMTTQAQQNNTDTQMAAYLTGT